MRYLESKMQRQQWIPSGMTIRKATAKTKATASCLVDGLHPTQRRVRDGWGTRFVVAVRTGIRATADPLRACRQERQRQLQLQQQRQRQQQIPYGMTTKRRRQQQKQRRQRSN